MWLDRAHTFWLAPNGHVFAKVNSMGALGDVDWADIGDFSQGILDSILKYKVASKYGPQTYAYGNQGGYPAGYYPPQGGGAYVGATSQGIFGGISSTTLLLIAGAFLLLYAMPPGRR